MPKKKAASNVTPDVEERVWQKLEEAFLEREKQRRQIERQNRKAREKKYGPEVSALLELAWAAGFWDGEGHAGLRSTGGGFHCTLDQEDLVNLERFQAVVGVGRIGKLRRRPSRGKGAKKRLIYTWEVTNQRDLMTVYKKIGLYLTAAKRNQFARALVATVRALLEKDADLPPGWIGTEVLPSPKRSSRARK